MYLVDVEWRWMTMNDEWWKMIFDDFFVFVSFLWGARAKAWSRLCCGFDLHFVGLDPHHRHGTGTTSCSALATPGHEMFKMRIIVFHFWNSFSFKCVLLIFIFLQILYVQFVRQCRLIFIATTSHMTTDVLDEVLNFQGQDMSRSSRSMSRLSPFFTQFVNNDIPSLEGRGVRYRWQFYMSCLSGWKPAQVIRLPLRHNVRRSLWTEFRCRKCCDAQMLRVLRCVKSFRSWLWHRLEFVLSTLAAWNRR